MTTTYLDPKVWGPHYWFFLHTVAMTYPHHPNAVTKKKYYEFIQNLPLFVPVEHITKELEQLIDQYPITPYLDNRDSFVRWMHFVHNKINEKLEKPVLSLNDFFVEYYNAYKSRDQQLAEYARLKSKLVYAGILAFLVGGGIYLYGK